MLPSILIVDDEASPRRVLAGHLQKKRVPPSGKHREEGQSMYALADSSIDFVLTGLNVPGRIGAELLADLQERNPETADARLPRDSSPLMIAQFCD